VIWKHFLSTKSAAEHGTLYQLRNLLGRSNVVTDPTKDFNPCEDFFLVVISGHIIAAAMKAQTMDDTPTAGALIGPDPDSVWMLEQEERKNAVCSEVIDAYVDFSFLKDATIENDSIHSYGKKLLGLGCFYMMP
jgi:L1 cell adhesion molecule like protein